MDDQNNKIREVLNECLLVLGAPKELRDVVSCWRNGMSDESVVLFISNWAKKNKQLNNMPSDNTNRPILLEIKSPLVGSLNVSVPCKCCHEVDSDYHHNPNKEPFQIAHNIRHLVEKALLESLTTSSAVPEILLNQNTSVTEKNIDLNLSSRGEDLMFQRIRNRIYSCMLLLGGDKEDLMHHILAWGDIANDEQTLEELDQWIEVRKNKLKWGLHNIDEVCAL